jgi:hypothetical protein
MEGALGRLILTVTRGKRSDTFVEPHFNALERHVLFLAGAPIDDDAYGRVQNALAILKTIQAARSAEWRRRRREPDAPGSEAHAPRSGSTTHGGEKPAAGPSGPETDELAESGSKAFDQSQERMLKTLDTLARPTTPPKGTPGTGKRRRGRRQSESTPMESEVWSLFQKNEGAWGVYGEVADILKSKYPAITPKTVGQIVRKLKARHARQG